MTVRQVVLLPVLAPNIVCGVGVVWGGGCVGRGLCGAGVVWGGGCVGRGLCGVGVVWGGGCVGRGLCGAGVVWGGGCVGWGGGGLCGAGVVWGGGCVGWGLCGVGVARPDLYTVALLHSDNYYMLWCITKHVPYLADKFCWCYSPDSGGPVCSECIG